MNLIATGNQDKTCKVWDVRCLKDPSAAKFGYCLKSLPCKIATSSKVMFAGDYGERLIFSEAVDYLHIYETKMFERH